MPEYIDTLASIFGKVPDINGREEYTNCAVLISLIKIDEDYHFVFEKRSSNIRQGGEVSFPGGKIDFKMDKCLRDTAIRETCEEIGIDESRIQVLGRADTIIAPMGAIIEGYVGILLIASLDELKPNKDEVEYIFSVPIKYFMKNNPEVYKSQLRVHPSYINQNNEEVVLFPAKELGLPEVYHKPWGRGENNIYLYRYDKEIIWGLTARFIKDVVERLMGKIT